MGYEDIVDIFCGPTQKLTGFRGHFYLICNLGSFLEVNVQNGDIFFFLGGGGCLNFNFFFFFLGGGGVCLIFQIVLGVNIRCCVQAYV